MTAEPTAVVIGGSRGIGRAIVDLLAASGWAVTTTGRDPAALEETATALAARGLTIRTEVADARDPDATRALAAAHPDTDLVVHNAGTSSAAPLARTSLEDWNDQLAVNATAAFLTLQAFVPAMVARGAGRAIVVASTAGLSGSPYISAYSAAKHAALGLVRSVAAEVAGTGVTVNAVCPHFVRTAMTETTLDRIERSTGRDREHALADLERSSRLGRLVEPEEVAAAVVQLAAPSSTAINGQALVLDGGGHW